MRSGIRGWHPVLAGALLALVLAPAAAAQGRDTVGLITEIKPGRGRVEVKPAAGGDWRVAGPLLALRAGDSVRATEDAAAVIVLTAGRGVVRVVAAVSPVVLPAGAGPDGKADKVLTLLESSLGFLSRTTKEAPKGLLATRSPVPPPVILTPRASLVRPEGLAFEWVGSARGRYAVRVVGAGGTAPRARRSDGDAPGVPGGRARPPAGRALHRGGPVIDASGPARGVRGG